MKNKSLKIISTLLTLILILSELTPMCLALNQPDDSFSDALTGYDEYAIIDALHEILTAEDAYDFPDVDLSSISVSQDIPVYEFDGSISQNLSFKMYPLLSDGELFAFAVVMDFGTEDASAQIYCNIAEDVISAGIDPADPVYFVYDCNGFNLVYGNQITLLSSIPDNPFNVEFQPAEDGMETEPVAYSASPHSIEDLPDTGLSLTASSFIYISDVPVVSQQADKYDHLCWAACVACIGEVLTGIEFTAVEVAEKYKGDDFDEAAYCSEALEALELIYDIEYTYVAAVPSSSRIYNCISEGYPLYGQFEGSSVTHAAVIYGINITYGTISIMDPYTESKITASYGYDSNTGEYTYGYANPYSSNTAIYLLEHLFMYT